MKLGGSEDAGVDLEGASGGVRVNMIRIHYMKSSNN